MATLDSWDFFNRNVQSGMVEGRYINAAFTLLAAGPPRLAAAGASGDAVVQNNIAFPVGIIQNFNLGQNAQVMRLFEIGSERSYFVRGRTVGNLGLGRIMYHGPSLLRVLYAYLGSSQGNVQFEKLYENEYNKVLNTSDQSEAKGGRYQSSPGSDNIWLNLASDVFSQPIGLMLLMRDSNNDTVGSFYFEHCHVVNHGFATDAGGTVISENAAITYDRMVPVDVSTVTLVKDADSIVGTVIDGNAVGSAV
jgi:hypothetical protein